MDIEAIEEWIGREVCGPDGEKLGKLKEVYYAGDTATLGEVKPGALSRKRLLVPLADATVTRDSVTVTGVQEDAATEGLEASEDRNARLAEIREAESRAAAADAEAARRAVDAEDAAAAAAKAEEERRVAEARLERIRNRG